MLILYLVMISSPSTEGERSVPGTQSLTQDLSTSVLPHRTQESPASISELSGP